MEVERAARRSAFVARSRKIFKKKRRPNMPLIREVKFGKSTVAKLRYTGTLATPSTGNLKSVIAMVATLQSSNDWSDFSTSYQFYNINKITVHIIPFCAAVSFSTPANGLCGMAYNGINAAQITNFNQIADHENYVTWCVNFVDPNTAQRYFKIKPKVKAQPPFATDSNAENYGYLRTYSNFAATGTSIEVATYIITFKCSFSGQA